MKWVIYGAGAIGGVVGARLTMIGQDVLLVARGEHLAAVQKSGITLVDPDGSHLIPIPAVGSLAGTDLADGDVIVLAMKTQHTAAALDDVVANAPAGVRILCMQNGLDNERQALRFFDLVYGVSVTLLASFTEPGVVVAHSSPTVGILQLGLAAGGLDGFVDEAAGTLRAAGIRVDTSDDVMKYKRLKLTRNLGNAVDVVCDGAAPTVQGLLSAEADAVFAATGLSLPAADEVMPPPEPVHPSVPRQGGSTLQSVLRGVGNVETDYLNGEIALLGREAGVPTPANATMQHLAREVARGTRAPRSTSEADVLALLGK